MRHKTFLLTADLHLTDRECDEYRWGIFETLTQLANDNRVDVIGILGDLSDRKDRHASRLINRLVDSLQILSNDTNTDIEIIEGNHDAPLEGTPYWSFLSSISRVDYIVEPTFDIHDEIWYLPFSSDPLYDWKNLPLAKAKYIFMHQTVSGSMIEGDRVLTDGSKLPPLPRGKTLVFSGDVHRPQNVGPITYVGAPYPVRFNENWKTRMLLVKDMTVREIAVPTIKKAILDITDYTQLPEKFKQNDQVRIRFRLSHEKLSQWPVEQEKIREWAQKKGITVASVEAVFDDPIRSKSDEKVAILEFMKPDQVIKTFSAEEKLDETVESFGISLLNQALAEN